VAEAARVALQGSVLSRLTAATIVAVLLACYGGTPASLAERPAPSFVERVVRPRSTAKTAKPPMLVLLHGIGSNENDLVRFARDFDPRLLVVSLRAPRPYHSGFAWFGLEFPAPGEAVPNVEQAHETVDGLIRWLGAAPARLGADPKRVYLLGFSQGAMMSLAVLRTAPARVAGVVALSGLFDDRLVTKPAPDAAVARVPVFVGHGLEDHVLPIADGRAIRDRFQPVVEHLTYREYPIEHTIGPDEKRDVAEWLTARIDDRAARQLSGPGPSRK
jgi:phospholipase/carboxylesterase